MRRRRGATGAGRAARATGVRVDGADLLAEAAESWATLPPESPYSSPFVSVDSTYRAPGGTPGIRATFAPDLDALAPLFATCQTFCETRPWDCLLDVDSWELTATHRVESTWTGYWTLWDEWFVREPIPAVIDVSERMRARVILERADPGNPASEWVSRSGSATASVNVTETIRDPDIGTSVSAGSGTRTFRADDDPIDTVAFGRNIFEPRTTDPENYTLLWPWVRCELTQDDFDYDEVAVGLFPPWESSEGVVHPGEPREMIVVDPIPTRGYGVTGTYAGELPLDYFPVAGGHYLDTPEGDPVEPTFAASWQWTLRPRAFREGCDAVGC